MHTIYTTLVDADHGATATAAIYRHSGFNGRASHRTRETRRVRLRSCNKTHVEKKTPVFAREHLLKCTLWRVARARGFQRKNDAVLNAAAAAASVASMRARRELMAKIYNHARDVLIIIFLPAGSL